jgi:hypothetical protein
VKNFQVICYLKFFPEERSKKLDSKFFTMFEKSKKPGVFWAHCDLASQISQFVSPVHVSNGTVQVTFTGELSYLLMRAVPYKWWARDYNIHISTKIIIGFQFQKNFHQKFQKTI